MSDSYESIPNSPGHHPGDTSDHEVGMSVRAENPPTEERSGEPPRLYQVVHHEEQGHYRVHRWEANHQPTVTEGYAEIGRYTSSKDLAEALEGLPSEERYVVLESARTGQVILSEERSLSGNLTEPGDFDQITLFDDRDEAAAYVDRRQRELDGGND